MLDQGGEIGADWGRFGADCGRFWGAFGTIWEGKGIGRAVQREGDGAALPSADSDLVWSWFT